MKSNKSGVVIALGILLTALSSFGGNPGTAKWNSPVVTANPVVGSPAIGSDGTIYVTTAGQRGSQQGELYAIDSGTGQVKPNWPIELHNSQSYSDELISSPAVAPDGSIYVASTGGFLYSINPNGTQKWALAIPHQFKFVVPFAGASVAAAPNGIVYVTYDDDDKLYAIDPSANGGKGGIKWMFFVEPDPVNGLYVNSCPSVGPDGTIYFDVNGYAGEMLVAVTDQGCSPAAKWTTILGFGEDQDDFHFAPVIDANGTIYVPFGTYASAITALKPADGSQKWNSPFYTPSGATIRSSPAIGPDGTIYFGADDGVLYALNSDGTLKWQRTAATDSIVSSPAVTADKTVYFGSGDGHLYAVRDNGSSGSPQWMYPASGEPALDAVISSPVIGADNSVYFGSMNSDFYALFGGSPLATSPWPMFRKNPTHTASLATSGPPDCPCSSPTITDVQIGGGFFSFQANGVSGTTLYLFTSDDLINWNFVQQLPLSGTSAPFFDSTSGLDHRFYKVTFGSCCSQIVGFKQTEVFAGTSALIANPFLQSSYTFSSLFSPMADGSTLPDGTAIGKLTPLTGRDGNGAYTYPYYGPDIWTYYALSAGTWSISLPAVSGEGSDAATVAGLSGNATLAPGEAAIIQNNSQGDFAVVFAGTVYGSDCQPIRVFNPFIPEWNLVSAIGPQRGTPTAVLGLKPAGGRYLDAIVQVANNTLITTVRTTQGIWRTGPAQPLSQSTLENLWGIVSSVASSGTPTSEPILDAGEPVFVWTFDNYFTQTPASAPTVGGDQFSAGTFAFHALGTADSFWLVYASVDAVNWHFAGGITLLGGGATFLNQAPDAPCTVYYRLVRQNNTLNTSVISGSMGLGRMVLDGQGAPWIANPFNFIYPDTSIDTLLDLSQFSGADPIDLQNGNLFIDDTNPNDWDINNFGSGWYFAFPGDPYYGPASGVTYGYGDSLQFYNGVGVPLTLTLHGRVPNTP